MLKKQLEDKIIELNNKNQDLARRASQAEIFVGIGDEKLIKAYEKFDKKLEVINKIKELLK